MTSHTGTFEDSYLAIRSRENRLLNAEQILDLPEFAPDPSQIREWQVRFKSASLLRDHLHHQMMNTVLELGCGNGWLTHFLSRSADYVIGLDINQAELEVAAKLFEESTFAYGDIESVDFVLPVNVDAIVIASAIQYFEDPARLLNKSLKYLTPGGEIHIIDSPIYKDQRKASEALARSRDYFTSLGMELPTYYHHHCWQDFGRIPINLLYNPNAVISRINRWLRHEVRPFPWLMIKKPR